jgi:hypothetical protein
MLTFGFRRGDSTTAPNRPNSLTGSEGCFNHRRHLNVREQP